MGKRRSTMEQNKSFFLDIFAHVLNVKIFEPKKNSSPNGRFFKIWGEAADASNFLVCALSGIMDKFQSKQYCTNGNT